MNGEKLLQVRVLESELATLKALQAETGWTRAQIIRALLSLLDDPGTMERLPALIEHLPERPADAAARERTTAAIAARARRS
ncbi:hypothetical protein ACTXJJ_06325 [Corynebacterium casei]|uniref:hypothetical protein n=1 Tax=Corynebacterium casei TaxID=160386 RepID=UPI003FB8DC25